MSQPYDIAVIGSGFAGSLFAMVARRLGHSVLLLESGRHPRVVIGESSTPLSNLLLEDLADRYDLPALKPLTKWGSWQQSYPGIACGLKRGFSFFHHDLARPQTGGLAAEHLLVAASPHDAIADTHWYRADLDHFLVQQAQSLGVDFVDQVRLERFIEAADAVLLGGHTGGSAVSFRARFVVDATGPRGFLHRALNLAEAPLPNLPCTQALYSHFSGVDRLDPQPAYTDAEVPPYPIDDAAVHHVFNGGWIWVLKFNNGITSAGVAATAEAAAQFNLSAGETAWTALLDRIPALRRQFAAARPVQPFTYLPRLSFRSSTIAGDRWAMLPSAAGFVDPLLSTGFPLSLLGVNRLAEIIAHHWNQPSFSSHLAHYAAKTDAELLATSHLIAALYANMGDFPAFRSLSLLYFAAASWSETARRLGKPHLAQSFLLHDHPVFGPQCRDLLARFGESSHSRQAGGLQREIHRLIHPIDIAGLCRTPRRPWYPVLADDLIDSAWKLGASTEQARSLLDRAGFYAAKT